MLDCGIMNIAKGGGSMAQEVQVDADVKMVVQRSEFDVTMELLKMAQHYGAIEDEKDLIAKFEKYYHIVKGTQLSGHVHRNELADVVYAEVNKMMNK